MEPKKTKDQSLVIDYWGDYTFKLHPGNASTKPHIHFLFQNPDTGKNERIRRFCGFKPGASVAVLRKEAKEAVKDVIDLLSGGWNPVTKTFNDQFITPVTPICECLDFFLKEKKNQFDLQAIADVTYRVNTYIVTFFKDWLQQKGYLYRKCNTITKVDIDNFLQHTAVARKWGKVSYNYYRTLLNHFFAYLLSQNIITNNPVESSTKKNTRNNDCRFKIFEEDELEEVINKLEDAPKFKNLHLAAKLVFKYNIRPIEITRLQVRDFDFERRTIFLPSEKTKNHQPATFTMDDWIYENFKKYLGKSQGHFYVFGKSDKPRLHKMNDHYFSVRWDVFKEQYGVAEHLKFYAIKHSSNYYDIQDGKSYEEIRQRNRHSSLAVTTIYVKERLNKNHIKPSDSARF